MLHLFANELAGLGRRRFPFALIFAGALEGFFLWHTKDTLPREPADVGWCVLRFERWWRLSADCVAPRTVEPGVTLSLRLTSANYSVAIPRDRFMVMAGTAPCGGHGDLRRLDTVTKRLGIELPCH